MKKEIRLREAIDMFGSPDSVITMKGSSNFKSRIWFRKGVIFNGSTGTFDELIIKKRYWLFGKEEVYVKTKKLTYKAGIITQKQYELYCADQILIEALRG